MVFLSFFEKDLDSVNLTLAAFLLFILGSPCWELDTEERNDCEREDL